MEKNNSSKDGWIVWILVAIFIIGGLYVYISSSLKKECEDRALAAAVDRYPGNEYPDTDIRGQLQEEYRMNYIRGACN